MEQLSQKPAKKKTSLHFTRRPSPLATLWHVLRGVSFSFDENEFGTIEALWPKAALDQTHLDKYQAICSVPARDTFPAFYHMTRIFSLIMRVLGHGNAPLTVFRTLNTEEAVYIQRPLKITEKPDIKCELARYRYVKNGLEVDIIGRVMVGHETLFKTVKTFLYRGKFNGRATPKRSLQKLENGSEVARWKFPGNVGFRFGLISGDTNAIHYLPRYARLQGFEGAFAQPILVMETCLQKIEAADLLNLHACSHEMKIHYKGPVYYEKENRLIYCESTSGHRFDIFCGDNTRPSIMFEIKKGQA